MQYYLASNHLPILAISESHLRLGARLQPYVHYQSDPPPQDQLPSVSLFVHKTFDQVPEDVSHLCTDAIQFVACTVTSRAFSLTIVSVYARPTGHFDVTSICTLRQRLPCSSIICGDFNAHHLCRGSTRTNSRVSALAGAIDSTDLILMNDFRAIYIIHQGASSMLDLTFASPDVVC